MSEESNQKPQNCADRKHIFFIKFLMIIFLYSSTPLRRRDRTTTTAEKIVSQQSQKRKLKMIPRTRQVQRTQKQKVCLLHKPTLDLCNLRCKYNNRIVTERWWTSNNLMFYFLVDETRGSTRVYVGYCSKSSIC